MYVGLKQPRGDGERYVTPARAAAKETTAKTESEIPQKNFGTTFRPSFVTVHKSFSSPVLLVLKGSFSILRRRDESITKQTV